MPEHAGFQVRQINGRALVHLRVRPAGVDAASEALQLPAALHWQGQDPVACWLGPDQWLLASDTQPAVTLIGKVNGALSAQLHAVTDWSSGYACIELKGSAARTVLAMGCGVDMHPQAFKAGQCVRTLFAGVSLLIVAVSANGFELYLERSLAGYFETWLAAASEDPRTGE